MRTQLVATLLTLAAMRAHAEPTQIALGAMVGGGSVELSGTRYGTADAAIDLSVVRWLSPRLGLGLRTANTFAMPLAGPRMDGRALEREVPWSFEPELLVRTRPAMAGPVALGWLASASAGVAWLETKELCGGDGGGFEEHDWGGPSCSIVVARATALAASASAGAYAEAHHVVMFLGVRAGADTGGDRAAGVVANLGASF